MGKLTDILGIGKTLSEDFARIGITDTEQLRGADPQKIFERLKRANEREQHATSRNYLYVIRMAVYAAEGGTDPQKLKWNAWSDARLAAEGAAKPRSRKEDRSWLFVRSSQMGTQMNFTFKRS